MPVGSSNTWSKKRTLVLLSICMAAATATLVWIYPPERGIHLWTIVFWLIYVGATATLATLPAYWYRRRGFDALYIGLQLLLVGAIIVAYWGIESWHFYPLFLLTVLLATLARRLAWAIGLAAGVAIANIYLGLATAPLEILLLQTAVLLVLSSLVGYLTEEIDREEASSVEIDNALEISSLLAGALEEQIVYDRLTEVLARVFRAGRVAVILSSPESEAATVVSSMDRGELLHDFQIDLDRYPEITAAIERQEPILIARARSHPRLASVHGLLPRRARDAAILVTPIVEDDEPRGVVFIRIEDPGHEFTEREVRFSLLMAEVAARALGGAEHFARVAEAARRDSLTGLLNIRAFHERLAEEIERSERTGAQISLLMIDVDYLKHVNDTFGHMAGDEVLKQMATILNEEVRNIDTVARYGGEEFVVLLPETSTGQARIAAERLRTRLESARHEGVPEPVTVSVGAATCPDDAMTPTDLIHKADLALYASKNRGRNRTTTFEETLEGIEDLTTFEDVAAPMDPRDAAMIETIREALRNLEGHRVLFRHLDVLASLAAVMRSKDPAASEHLRDVSTIADLFLAHLPIAEQQRWEIHVACMLRDIGKFAISDAVLRKRGYLTSEEFATVRQHPIISAQIISPLKGLDGLIPFVRHHHERWDGKGYPDGLRGDEIPHGARVVGLIDAFHAMVRGRPYAGRSRGLRYAREEIRRNAGSQFDPDLAARFLEVVDANVDILSTLVSRIETGLKTDERTEVNEAEVLDELVSD